MQCLIGMREDSLHLDQQHRLHRVELREFPMAMRGTVGRVLLLRW